MSSETRQAGPVTYALANRPEMTLEESMMGPSSAARLLRIRGLTKSLLGRVTAAESTCMPNTMRVNWSVKSALMIRAHP